MSQGELIIL